jgi:hypothetical protein
MGREGDSVADYERTLGGLCERAHNSPVVLHFFDVTVVRDQALTTSNRVP